LIAQYIKRTISSPTTWQRLKWSQQAAEGTAYILTLGVLHCDINVNNLLLDKDLNVKLADFQGRYISPDRITLLDGLSSENVKSSIPRSDPNHADEKTDVFALGSAIYYIMTGHEPFPELDSLNDDHEAEIVSLYRSGQFPHLIEKVIYVHKSSDTVFAMVDVSLHDVWVLPDDLAAFVAPTMIRPFFTTE
jgi:serine/threonine protein kinase